MKTLKKRIKMRRRSYAPKRKVESQKTGYSLQKGIEKEDNVTIDRITDSLEYSLNMIFPPLFRTCLANQDYEVISIAFVVLFLFKFFKKDIIKYYKELLCLAFFLFVAA